ncbi:hypothetical protein RSOLAG1IB_08159 [Rhizoctonia solani AG-1 IB]|uniref:Amidase domain-containing protein n=1 Tax=Thanatephorus cucumeris (strain AG1-IB / isolate 7/3/14) TaxID=1108050 RepID=A0A0B7FFS1_THACB|nr:hypothetical protein RSOLAG1IB_08159 [Rhizoctonia solani AG-1 IB]
MPWNHSLAQGEKGEKLSIGIFIDDGVVAPHPPIVEALRRVRDDLVSAGHEVIDWEPMDHQQAIEVIVSLIQSERDYDINALLLVETVFVRCRG